MSDVDVAYRSEEGIVGELGPEAPVACGLACRLHGIFPLLQDLVSR